MENLAEAEKDISKIKQLSEVLQLKCQQAIEELKIEKLNYV